MEHFMNLVLIKNIYIGIPMAALICYLFLLFCFLNVAEKSSEVRDLKAILSALLSWTGGAVLMRLQISPGIQFWYHVSLMGLFTIPILIYDFLFHYLDIRGKDRFLYGCMAVTVSAVLLNVFTGCILPPPEVQIMANGGISYHYHAKTGIWLLAAAEIFLLVYVTLLAHKKIGGQLEYRKKLGPLLIGTLLIMGGNILCVMPWSGDFPFDTLGGVGMAVYTITMDLDGGSGQEKVVYTITDEDFELPTPTRNGYEFVGWTGERITTPQTSVKIPKGSTGNKAYTANWKVIRYTITLVTNGGAVIASIRYTVEDSVTLPIPPDRPGYEFAGWVLDGSGQFPSTPMIIPKGSTGDRIYKAEWRVASYTITYVSHGKAYNWVQYTINNSVYFSVPEEDPSYYLPGYTFVGWKIDGVSGTPHSYMLPKGSYGNRTATMLWEPIP